jgi:uncharacterized protein (UPF0548 family)
MAAMTPMARGDLAGRSLSYDAPGATRPADDRWSGVGGFERYEGTVSVGHGDRCWRVAAATVLSWEVKTRSGFSVEPSESGGRKVALGHRYWLVARVGPLTVREPVQVVAVVQQEDRCGFAYGTLDGHPVSGEEAFIAWRAADGGVSFTLRSLTRPGRGWWRVSFPVARLAQRRYRRRYLSAVEDLTRTS